MDEEGRQDQALVLARGLVFAYGARRVIDDVSLTFEAGHVHVLMGPNGAGKSSLVRLLAGSRRPLSGTVDVVEPRAARQPVGLVPQAIALYPWLTARENCYAFARILGLDRALARKRTAEALRLAQCEDVADVAVRHLSGGYQRRVNIAAALVGDPLFLILDEPTVGVDLAARRAIAQTIEALRASGTAILLVTHDFAEADGLADRVAFLSQGRILHEGPPPRLIAEAFGGARRIEVVLATPPGAARTSALAAWGARPGANEITFVAYRHIEGWNATELARELQTIGLDVAEIRLRDPGLECLYARLCANETEAARA